jgi:hypothetical protein
MRTAHGFTEAKAAAPTTVEVEKKERKSLGGTIKNKLRMTMDGTLKEKRSQSGSSGQGKNKFWHSKKK